ncbi:hypothetical protein [Sphingomonas sp. PP-CC-3G-468]|uniref:HTH domain-containing protein n=1 Tax=Sphingomonas sp. PP-CC-3G-468 TaxID=2135656 RepID=UPI00104E8955|nr:hypothetical protein [Sphingomonas sp. PP-CC-3G-468]TCM07464.1 hypothetical protein C8J41_103372 [Sphingomonas sp. PP-CC-3G-468]
MDPFVISGVRAAVPAVRAGFAVLRRELARREQSERPFVLKLDQALDEAVAVLAQTPETLSELVSYKMKGLIGRNESTRHPVAASWLATELVQVELRASALALIRGGSEEAHATILAAHYESIRADLDDGTAPSADEAYAAALGFVLRSLSRDLSVGEQLILERLDGLAGRLERRSPAEASIVVDAHVRDQVMRLRKRRFFRNSETPAETISFGTSLIEGPASVASPAVRADALAWCARFIAYSETALAAHYCAEARTLLASASEELMVAEAFVAATQDWERSLRLLDVDASPLQATAALQIMRRGLDAADALARSETAGIGIGSLDGDGKLVWITTAIEAGEWERAVSAILGISERDFDQTPALYWIGATALVASRLPDDLRRAVLQDIPLSVANYPLSDESEAFVERRVARNMMRNASERCAGLGLDAEANGARRYALWLGLRDPETFDAAIDELRDRMAETGSMMAHLPLAIGFGLQVDRKEAERLIERDVARGAIAENHLAGAALALVFDAAARDPDAGARLIARHRPLLEANIEAPSILGLEIRLLIDADRRDEAHARLAATGNDLPKGMRAILEAELSGDVLRVSIDTLEENYRLDPDTRSLVELVGRHRLEGFSPRYLELAREMLRQMPTATGALEVLRFLESSGEAAEALAILDGLGAVVDRSEALLAKAAELWFRAGRLEEAERALAKLEARRDDEGDRAMRFRFLVTTGRWTELEALVERGWRERGKRTPLETASAAALASRIHSKRAGELIRAAVAAAPEDPEVLLTAYSAATATGVEEEMAEASSWIVRAAELSGPGGPIQMRSLSELMAEKPAWDDRIERAGRALATAEVPVSVVAALLRRSWLEMQLVPLLTNPDTPDVRRQSAVPLYSGKRVEPASEPLVLGGAIALDRTAVVTLAAFDLLDDVFDGYDRVNVSHDLLADVFEQQNRIDFHQPSRIEFANQLVTLLGRRSLRAFEATGPTDRALAADIGGALAALIREATRHDDGQHVVVHPYPITRVGSLLTEPVDLHEYRDRLVSCSAVVDALVREGRLVGSDEARARAYLRNHDEAWPEEPVIRRGATLYLSDVAVSYLRYVGVLEHMAAAGLTVVVSQAEIDLAQALREREALTGRVGAVVESLRTKFAGALASGRVALDMAPADDEERELSALAHLAGTAPVIVFDDRYFNSHPHFETEEGTTRIASTLDLVDALTKAGSITTSRRDEILTRLRIAGALFVPVAAAELITALAEAGDEGGRVRETAGLRAIRENVRLAQASGWFEPKQETPWVLALQTSIAEALIAQWNVDTPHDAASARSDWLWSLNDTRDWSGSAARIPLGNVALLGSVLDATRLIGGSLLLKGDPARRFSSWLEDALDRSWVEEPKLRDLLASQMRGHALHLDRQIAVTDPQLTRGMRTALVMRSIPSFVQSEMLEDPTFRARLDIDAERIASLGEDATFRSSHFMRSIERAYARPGDDVVLRDQQKRRWTVTAATASDDWALAFRRGRVEHLTRGMVGLLEGASDRVASFDSLIAARNIPPAEVSDWRGRLDEGPLDGDALEELDKELSRYPGTWIDIIQASLVRGEASIDMIVPTDPTYYEYLTGDIASPDLDHYVRNDVPSHLARLSMLDPIEHAKGALLLASHPRILDGRWATPINDASWIPLGAWVLASGDLLARIGFFEIALPHARDNPELARMMIDLAKGFDALDPQDEAGELQTFAALVMLVDGSLSLEGTFRESPPFRRRIAAFAHAALVARVIGSRIDRTRFVRYCAEQRGWRYLLQTLCDMRAEPRWRPDYLSAVQLRNEILGRVINAASTVGRDGLPIEITEMLFDADRGLAARMPFPMTFWPGPVEGGLDHERGVVSDELLNMVEEASTGPDVTPAEVTLLVNIQSMHDVPDEVLERAIRRLEASGPRWLKGEEQAAVATYLDSLAHVAAQRRRPDLADLTLRLARTVGRDIEIGCPNSMQLILITAACAEDPEEWRERVGRGVEELALNADEADAEVLENWIETLCAIDPRLRTRTGRTLAVLRHLLGR